VIGEQRSVRAFLEAEELVREEIEVEVRPSSPTTDPRSGWPLTVPPLVILWVGERPLAVRLRSVVAISRFPTNPRLANLVEGEGSALGFAVERMPEAGLWRLFSQPPRPRRVGL
jgi:hypothetical protein